MTTKNCYLKPLHWYGYRRKNLPDPKITGVFMVKPDKFEPRPCYQITYEDGFIDYIPISDVEGGNYMITHEL